jgi:hypothetical protein
VTDSVEDGGKQGRRRTGLRLAAVLSVTLLGWALWAGAREIPSEAVPFPREWTVGSMVGNTTANRFWETTVASYTDGAYRNSRGKMSRGNQTCCINTSQATEQPTRRWTAAARSASHHHLERSLAGLDETMITDDVTMDGQDYVVTWLPPPFAPPRELTSQCGRVCFADGGQIAVVTIGDGRWGLPAGHPESGESLPSTTAGQHARGPTADG